jgi:hypothetical protein
VKIGGRLAIVVVLTTLGALVAQIGDPGGPFTGLVVLAGAVAVGEYLVLRPRHRSAVPLSYAFMLVIIRAFPPAQVVVAFVAAETLALVVRHGPLRRSGRVSAGRVVVGSLGLLVYSVLWPRHAMNDTAWLLTVLAAAGVTMIAAHELLQRFEAHRLAPVGGADLALVTSGMLMAIGYRGVDGHQSVGLWGVLLFSVPLLAAWFSYERLAVISRTSEQTILALSAVPEMAGLARGGHAARVADLAVAVGAELDMKPSALDDLRAASLLHHLGHLCLDAPEVRDAPVEPHEVADKGAEILRRTDLAAAGDLLATDHVSLGGQILRVCSAYDDLRAGCTGEEAIDRLAEGPGFLYDPRVLDALERVARVRAGSAA